MHIVSMACSGMIWRCAVAVLDVYPRLLLGSELLGCSYLGRCRVHAMKHTVHATNYTVHYYYYYSGYKWGTSQREVPYLYYCCCRYCYYR